MHDALAAPLPLRTACTVLGVQRSGAYRRKRPAVRAPARTRRSARALAPAERQALLDAMHEPRFMDRSPREVVYTLLDEGIYHGSWRTAYRVLNAAGESGERREQRRHPPAIKPQLVATAPLSVWCWDITRLATVLRTWLYLHVLIDLYSRFVVGWLIDWRESAAQGARLIEAAHRDWNIPDGALTVHNDRGAPMTALSYTRKMALLQVGVSYSRPRVSNDNPHIESHFRTLKYRPDYPGRFLDMRDAVRWGQHFFAWHNYDHRHEGLGFLTPATVHFGRTHAVLDARRKTLMAAQLRHPERFVRGQPRLPVPPMAVTINSPVPAPKEVQNPVINTPTSTLNSSHRVSQIC